MLSRVRFGWHSKECCYQMFSFIETMEGTPAMEALLGAFHVNYEQQRNLLD